MKKLVAVVGLLTCAAALFAADTVQEDLQTQVAKSAAQAALNAGNSGAINQNTLVDFNVQDFYEGATDAKELRLHCKAYPLSAHWLLVAGTCAKAHNGLGLGAKKLITQQHLLIPADLSSRFAYNERILLVWSAKYNFTGPFVNVLATTSPKQVFTLSAFMNVKINTSRFGKNAVRTRQLGTPVASKNPAKKLFTLAEKLTDLSGTATDPLFLIEQDGAHNEFLTAYNNGILNYAEHPESLAGNPSPNWYSLQKEDLQFIKDTVLNNRYQDWAQIKTRLFYNDTKTPYFND